MSTITSSTTSIRPEGWIDKLSDGKATKVIAAIPVVSTVIVFMKNHRLHKDLKSSGLSDEQKMERLKRVRLFNQSVDAWSAAQAIVVVAVAVLSIALAAAASAIPPLLIVAGAVSAVSLCLFAAVGGSWFYFSSISEGGGEVRNWLKEKSQRHANNCSAVYGMIRIVCQPEWRSSLPWKPTSYERLYAQVERMNKLRGKLEAFLKDNKHYLDDKDFLGPVEFRLADFKLVDEGLLALADWLDESDDSKIDEESLAPEEAEGASSDITSSAGLDTSEVDEDFLELDAGLDVLPSAPDSSGANEDSLESKEVDEGPQFEGVAGRVSRLKASSFSVEEKLVEKLFSRSAIEGVWNISKMITLLREESDRQSKDLESTY